MPNLKRFAGATAWLPLVLAVAAVFAVVWQLARPIEAGRAESRCPARLKGLDDTVRIGGAPDGVASCSPSPRSTARASPYRAAPCSSSASGSERGVMIRRQTFRVTSGTPSISDLQAPALINDFVDGQRDRVLPVGGRPGRAPAF